MAEIITLHGSWYDPASFTPYSHEWSAIMISALGLSAGPRAPLDPRALSNFVAEYDPLNCHPRENRFTTANSKLVKFESARESFTRVKRSNAAPASACGYSQ